MKKIIVFCIVLVLIVMGLVFIKPNKTTVISPAPNSDIKNATYIIDGSPITLVNGYSEIPPVPGSSSKIVTRYFGNEAKADLNNDGKEDTAFLLTHDRGGSGTFYFVVVALKTDAGYTGTNAIFLGDRIAPQTTEIKNGVITVNYADRLSSEPFTTKPSIGVSRYFKIEGGKLVEIKGEFGD